AVDGSSNILLLGFFNNTVNFGGGNRVSAGQRDVVLAKYNSAGTHQWSNRFGGTSDDLPYNLATDAAGNINTASTFYGTADFGGGNLTSAGTSDIALARYNSAGVHQWSGALGGAGIEAPGGLAADAAGNAVLAGTFHNTVDFGGGNLSSLGNADVVLARY